MPHAVKWAVRIYGSCDGDTGHCADIKADRVTRPKMYCCKCT